MPPAPSTPVPGTAAVATLAQEFIALIERGDFAAAFEMLDPTMRDALPEAKLAETWQALLGQVGDFKGQGNIRLEKAQGFDVALVRAEFGATALDVRVVFDAERRIAGLFFVPAADEVGYEPPVYSEPDSFTEEETTVGTGEWSLPGTLTVPNGDGPFPAVVLVHGSGPNDRDETVGPNKPFKDLAWGLASQGIAVLRYDKRTNQHGQRMVALVDGFTVYEETVEDALEAVSLLRDTGAIDRQRIFVVGHSLGGMLVPRIAALDSGIAGFIIMAGATEPIEDMMLIQTSYLSMLDGVVTEDEQAVLDQLKLQVDRVKALSDGSPATELILGAPATYWLDLRGYDPASAAADIDRPILVLQGDRDYQVTPDHLERWREALSSLDSVEFAVYPTLNHLFIGGEGPGSPTEYQVIGHVAVDVINDIAGWLHQR